MKQDEFYEGWEDLCLMFEKNIKKPEFSRKIYERVQGFRASDWIAAVERLTEDPEQRIFPRLGQILKALYAVAEDRIELEANEQKDKERREIEAIMSSKAGDTIMANNKLKIKKLLKAIGEGAEAVDKLAVEDQDESNKEILKRGCLCEDGLVFYEKQNGMKDGKPSLYRYIAACTRCKLGRAQPKAYPRLDPVSVQS